MCRFQEMFSPPQHNGAFAHQKTSPEDAETFNRGLCNLLSYVSSTDQPTSDDDFEPIPLEPEDPFDALIEEVLGEPCHDARSEDRPELQVPDSMKGMVVPFPDPIKFSATNQEEPTVLHDQSSAISSPLDFLPQQPVQSNQQPVQEVPIAPEKPKRGLTAYNYFFQAERKRLLETLPAKKKKPQNSHGKIGFADLARTISSRWKKLTPVERSPYASLAQMDSLRYKKEKKLWEERQQGHAALEFLGMGIQDVQLEEDFLPQLQQLKKPQQGQEQSFINFHWSHGGNNMFLRNLQH
mmetsp:Transcript_29490/g.81037  ORF Transcript_29490/g.81037 Transcript_29490/m.81037 type:complete len:295 (-) Transcript_29490:244-1128(-)